MKNSELNTKTLCNEYLLIDFVEDDCNNEWIWVKHLWLILRNLSKNARIIKTSICKISNQSH